MTLLAVNWAEVGIKAGQFILSFSIIVVLHELGHFLPAKWFKCRVEKFYLFFNPWFSLAKKKIGETEYGLGWVPFGGYVKISGMIDESMDKDAMKEPPKPWEFRSKPAWQRLIIMLGGVTVNLVLGFLIYAMMLWYWGDEYVPVNKFAYGISTDSLAQSIGLRDGDKILALDGKYVDKIRNIRLNVILKDTKTFLVDRNGQQLTIKIPPDFAKNLLKYKAIDFIDMRVPFNSIDSVVKDMPAGKMGLQKGDRVLTVNDNSTAFYHDYRKLIVANKGKQVNLKVLRGQDTVLFSGAINKDGVIGTYPDTDFEKVFEVKKVNYSFFQAIPAGYHKSVETLESYWLQLKLIFSKKVKTSESLGSVISIGNMFPPQWDWAAFWSLTAFFSLVLALMNILPIPALDGGHALFTLYEMITGRKPSDKFIEYAQMAGMVLLLGLMAYALGLDIFRLFK
ncbi:MAG: RIP metalloprotease RseP [Chitinophagaceae bacterium]